MNRLNIKSSIDLGLTEDFYIECRAKWISKLDINTICQEPHAFLILLETIAFLCWEPHPF